VSVVVERDRAPTGEEARELLIGYIFKALKERGDLDHEPRFALIEVLELRDHPPDTPRHHFTIRCQWPEDKSKSDGELKITVELPRAPPAARHRTSPSPRARQDRPRRDLVRRRLLSGHSVAARGLAR